MVVEEKEERVVARERQIYNKQTTLARDTEFKTWKWQEGHNGR